MPKTPEEIRASIAASVAALTAAASAGAPAAKAADDDKKKKDEEADSTKKAAYGKAGELAGKAMDAMNKLRGHVESTDAISDEHKEACAKAHKAMKAAASNFGEGDESAEGKKGMDAEAMKGMIAEAVTGAMSGATKTIETLQAQLTALATKGMGPKAGGAGAPAVVVARKGMGTEVQGGEVAGKLVGDMTPAEREQAALKAIGRTRLVPISMAQFAVTGNEVLGALDEVASKAMAEEEQVAQV